MRKIFISVLSATVFVSLALVSCKKSSDDPAPIVEQQQTQASDQSLFTDATNEVLNSVSDGLNQKSAARLTNTLTSSFDVANATVNLSTNKDTLTIEFNGDNAEGTRTRTGKVFIYLQDPLKRWYDKDAKFIVAFGNPLISNTGLVITRKSDNKMVRLMGSKTITNLTGGNIATTDSVAHQIDGQLSLLFDYETTVRVWTVARIRTVIKDGLYYRVKIAGNTVNNGFTNVSEYGVNRFGSVFTTAIDSPLVLNYCNNKYKFVSGLVSHHRIGTAFSVTYGVDDSGVAATIPCNATSIKIQYTSANNGAVTIIKPY